MYLKLSNIVIEYLHNNKRKRILHHKTIKILHFHPHNAHAATKINLSSVQQPQSPPKMITIIFNDHNRICDLNHI